MYSAVVETARGSAIGGRVQRGQAATAPGVHEHVVVLDDLVLAAAVQPSAPAHHLVPVQRVVPIDEEAGQLVEVLAEPLEEPWIDLAHHRGEVALDRLDGAGERE